jgi:lipopolysaccharide biosynthesis glycosyltransferase
MKTAIAIVFDANYIEKAAIFIDSLSENYHGSEKLDITCVVPEYESKAFDDLKKLVSITPRIHLIKVVYPKDLSDWISGAVKQRFSWVPSMTWYRLFLGTVLPDYDKVIYFDVDALVVDNIQPILDHKMYSPFMATVDVTGFEIMFLKSRGELPRLHAGTLIADLNWWRDSGIEDEFRAAMEEWDLTLGSDEDLLNRNETLRSNWTLIPFTFNFLFFTRDAYGIPDFDSSESLPLYYKHAIMIHFASQIKPWNYKKIVGKEDPSRIGAEWRRREALIKARK